MPLRKQGTLVKSIAIVFATSAATVAAPGAAMAATTATAGTTAASCVQAPTTKAFSKFGDQADYSLAPGGDFESSAGWTLTSGANIVSGNENLGVTGGSKALSLPFGATATSPQFCVDASNPYFRFAAMPANSLAGYKAIVIYRDAGNKVTNAQFTSSSDASWGAGKWAPSKVSPLATKIPLTSSNPTASVQLSFISTGNLTSAIGLWGGFAKGSVGTTMIDSVLVDPYRKA